MLIFKTGRRTKKRPPKMNKRLPVAVPATNFQTKLHMHVIKNRETFSPLWTPLGIRMGHWGNGVEMLRDGTGGSLDLLHTRCNKTAHSHTSLPLPPHPALLGTDKVSRFLVTPNKTFCY